VHQQADTWNSEDLVGRYAVRNPSELTVKNALEAALRDEESGSSISGHNQPVGNEHI
jgi:hypothetical protein